MSIAENLERADLRSYIRFGIQSYPTSSPKIHVISCYDFGRCLARCEFPEARYPWVPHHFSQTMSWIKDLDDREIPSSLVRMMTNGNSIRNLGTDQNSTQRMDFVAPWLPWMPILSFGIIADATALHLQCFTCSNVTGLESWALSLATGYRPQKKDAFGLVGTAAHAQKPRSNALESMVHSSRAVLSSRAQGLKDESSLW